MESNFSGHKKSETATTTAAARADLLGAEEKEIELEAHGPKLLDFKLLGRNMILSLPKSTASGNMASGSFLGGHLNASAAPQVSFSTQSLTIPMVDSVMKEAFYVVGGIMFLAMLGVVLYAVIRQRNLLTIDQIILLVPKLMEAAAALASSTATSRA